MLKKVLLATALIVSCALIGFPHHTALAQSQNPSQPVDDPDVREAIESGGAAARKSKNVKEVVENDKGYIEGKAGAKPNLNSTVIESAESAVITLGIYSLIGKPAVGPGAVTYGPDGSIVAYKREGGALQSVTSALAFMYETPAASSTIAMADFMNSVGVAPAYAQGVGLGFSSLSPILDMWRLFRNIAYFFFVLVILAIGFMIMFRQKIGQTAVTAQQAIPNVIVALITVSFSYAIAGFLIDIMYLIMYFLAGILGVGENLISNGVIQIGIGAIGNSFNSTWDAFDNLISGALPLTDIGGDFSLSSAFGLTFTVVVSVAILISIFRLFFEMIKTYMIILISIVTAPLLLMMSAIPGRNTFNQWLKNLVGNLSAFPIVLTVFAIFYRIQELSVQENMGGFNPPYVFWDSNTGGIVALLGIGMLMIITDLVIQGKKTFGAGGGIFEQFAGNFSQALKAGWTGDANLIPGMGWSNLARSPFTSWMGGVSGENFAKKSGTAAATLLGAGGGLARGAIFNPLSPSAILGSAYRGGAGTGQRLADFVDDKQLFTRFRKERKEGKKRYGETS